LGRILATQNLQNYYYTPSVFGKMKKNEDTHYFDSEHDTIENIKKGNIELYEKGYNKLA